MPTVSPLSASPSPRSARASGTSTGTETVARFALDVVSGRWTWSDELFAMHGFAPGEVVPTIALMASHEHPDDRARVQRALAAACRSGDAFSVMHRIVDAAGATRTVTIVGQGAVDDGGTVLEVSGYFLDVTEVHVRYAQEEASRSIRAAAESRGTIEQAKGVLMAVRGGTAEQAFEVLRAHSSRTNVPIRELARALLDRAGSGTALTDRRGDVVDGLLGGGDGDD